MVIKTFKQWLTEQEFFGNAGAGILVIAKDTKRILLAFRSSDVNEPHTWGVVGGAIQDKENPKAGAKREFIEETKYKGPMKIKRAYVFKKDDFKYYNFIGIVPHEFSPTKNWETEKFEWFDIDKFPSSLHFGLKALLKNSKSLLEK